MDAETAGGGEASPTTAAELSVEVRSLTKRFGDFVAVDGVSFSVRRGEIFGFIGPNGSGKTTTIRMLMGALPLTSGTIRVLGLPVPKQSAALKPQLGYMSQRFSLFSDLTVAENLTFYGSAYGLSATELEAGRAGVVAMAGLETRENELVANLSTGKRQRLALGVATLHKPKLLILDEPTSGVDPVGRREFWNLLYDLSASGVTLFVTTHYMDEAMNCSRLAFMYAGKIVADGAPRELQERYAPGGGRAATLEEVFAQVIGSQDRQSTVEARHDT